VGLVTAIGIAVGTGLLDAPLRLQATQMLSQSAPSGLGGSWNASLAEPHSVLTLEHDVSITEPGRNISMSALDLARAEPDTQAALEPPPVVQETVRARPVRADVN